MKRMRTVLTNSGWLALWLPVLALAGNLPTLPEVKGGAATFAWPSADQMRIDQSTGRAVIHWDSFNIGQNAGVTFVQPDKKSATLNIVNDANSSQLGGQLNANGSVYVINPYGITVTPTGMVNTGGAFVASTLSVSETDFMNGTHKLSFEAPAGTTGHVINQGNISAQDAVLLGGQVSNEGNIQVNVTKGRIVLGSASQATLDISGDGFLQVLAPADVNTTEPLLSNSGSLIANGGSVQLSVATLRDSIRNAIYMPGTVQAQSVSGQDGAISFEGGKGGKVTISGMVDVTPQAGASKGGSVSISGSHAEVDFSQITAGKRGELLLSVNGIQISANGGVSDDQTTYIQENSVDRGLHSQLVAGTNVTLEANNDIDWLNGLMIRNEDFSQAGGQAGNVTLRAGRSITLGSGYYPEYFDIYNSSWTLIANAKPKVETARKAGPAEIFGLNSRFIGGDGELHLLLMGGEGRADRAIDEIRTPVEYAGTAFSAYIDPAAINYDEAHIRLYGDVVVSGDIILSGHLLSNKYMGGEGELLTGVTLKAGNLWDYGHFGKVDWTTEKVGGQLLGGGLQFIENGAITRFGSGGGGADAVRLELGNGGSVSRHYGEAEPDQLALGNWVLQEAAHNQVPLDGNVAFGDILQPGSIQVTGPSVTADVGHYGLTLSIGDTVGFAVDGGMAASMAGDGEWGEGAGSSNYWIDFTGGTADLEVTPRPITASLLDPAYTYGFPVAAIELNGVVNNDQSQLLPVGDVAGDVINYQWSNGGYVLPERTSAGEHNYALSGLAGSKAANYSLDATNLQQGQVNILRKAITYVAQDGQQTYGEQGSLAAAQLQGVLGGDQISPIAGLAKNGLAVTWSERTAKGQYDVITTSLSGADANNYQLTDTGSTTGIFKVNPKPITWSVADASSVYGSFVPGEASFDTVLFDDVINAKVGLWDANGQVKAANRADIGHYTTKVFEIDNPNYVLASSGNSSGQQEVTPYLLNWSVRSENSVYGDSIKPFFTSLSLMDWDQGIVQGKVVSLNVAGSPIELTNRSDTGQYQLIVTELTGNAAKNYVLADSSWSNNNTYLITPRPLQWRVEDGYANKYGELFNPRVSFAGLLEGDEVAASRFLAQDADDLGVQITRDSRIDAGFYRNVSVTRIAGADASNYVLASSGNTPADVWRVAPRPIQLGAGQASEVYGDDITSDLFADSLQLSGVLLEDRAGVGLQLDVWLNNQYVDIEETQLAVGNYDVRGRALTGYRANNYVLQADKAGQLEITPRPVTWRLSTAAKETYGTAPGYWSVQFGNLAYNDNGAALGGKVKVTLYDSDNQAVHLPFVPGSWVDVGSYTTQVTELSDSNYVLASSGNQAGKVDIIPRHLFFHYSGAGQQTASYGQFHEYSDWGDFSLDSNTPLAVASEVNWLATIESPQLSTGGFLQVGRYQIIPELSGKDVGNYEVISSPRTLDILKKQVSRANFSIGSEKISEDGKVVASYGRMTDFQLINELIDIRRDDAVSATLSGGNLEDVGYSSGGYLNAGEYYFTINLAGEDATNYWMGGEGEVNVVINKRALNFPLTVANQQYSDVYYYQLGEASRLLEGDHVTPEMMTLIGASPVLGDTSYEWKFSHNDGSFITHQGGVGSYQLAMASLAGADSGNYSLSPIWERFVIDPLPVTLIPQNITVHMTYGGLMPQTSTQFELSYYNATLGRQESFLGSGEIFNQKISIDVALPEDYIRSRAQSGYQRADVGTYGHFRATGLTVDSGHGGWEQNFKIVNPNITSGQLVVNSRLLSVDFSSPRDNHVYGDALSSYTWLDGVLPGDQVKSVAMVTNKDDKSRPISIYPGEAVQEWARELMSEYNLTESELILGPRLPVGDYRYWLRLADRDAGNYRLDTETYPFEVIPRTLNWYIPYSRIQYGNFESCDNPLTCHAPPPALSDRALNDPNTPRWVIESYKNALKDYQQKYGINPNSRTRYYAMYVPATEAEPELLGGVQQGDDIQAITGLVDFNGLQGEWDDKPTVGSYFHVVKGLTGADTGNYVLADSGNVPGMLTVEPQWVRWWVESALYTPETGFVGIKDAGLSGSPTPTPWLPNSVKSVIATKTKKGEAVSTSDNIEPGLYRLHVVGLTGKGSENYRIVQTEYDSRGNKISDPGYLSVFADSSFGMDMVNRVDLVAPQHTNRIDKAEGDSSGSLDSSDSVTCDNSPSCQLTREISREDKAEFGSNDVNLAVSSYVEVMAEFGVTGITLQAKAEQRITIEYEIGPGYVSKEVYLSQQAELMAGKDGVAAKGSVETGVLTKTGVKGGIDGVGEGRAEASGEAYAKAEVVMQARIENGKLKVEQSMMAGAGAQAGVNAGIDGETGSVNAGVVVYSPGTVGIKPSLEVGFSDGRLKVDLGLGLAIGFFGGELNFGFEVDFNAVGKAIKNAANAVADAFSSIASFFGGGSSSGPSPDDYAQTALSMKNDPMARYQYLVENTDWAAADRSTYAYQENMAFFNSYTEKAKAVKNYLDQQKQYQNEMTSLLEQGRVWEATNLARKLAQKDWTQEAKNKGIRPEDLASLGIELLVKDGEMRFKNIN